MLNSSPFAQRTGWSLDSNQLSLELKRLRDQNFLLYDLTESNPTRCQFDYLTQGIVNSLAHEENIQYVSQSQGSMSARGVICDYYKEKGFNVEPHCIFLTASTSEAYSYLFRLLADPKDKVLFPCPGYPLFSFLGELNDVDIDTYSLVYENEWKMDLEYLRHNLNNYVKAVVLVNPNNPTGSFVKNKELNVINELCHDSGTAIICDEVFMDFDFDSSIKYASLVENNQVLTFTLGGISKTLGLPQMKLSWIVVNGPENLVEEAVNRLEVIADTYLSVNTPTQNALPAWFSTRQTIQKEIKTRTQQNLDYLNKCFSNVKGCRLLKVEGGWYAVLTVPQIKNEEEWAITFLKEDQVIVHPGYFYDFDTQAHIVMSLLPPEGIFQEGINRVRARIEKEAA